MKVKNQYLKILEYLNIGGSLSSCNANDGRLPHGLRSSHEWPLCPGSVGRPVSHVADAGDAGCVSCTETLPSRPKGTSCACPHRQHIGGLLHQPTGGSALTPPLQAGAPDPPVGSGKAPLTQSSLHPWAPQSGSIHHVETWAEAWGMEAPPRGGGAPLEGVRPGGSGSICVTGNDTLSCFGCPSRIQLRLGCHGADVAEVSSVHFSPDRSAPESSGKSTPGRGPSSASSPVLASLSMVLRPCVPPRRLSAGDSDQEGPPLSVWGHHPSPLPGLMETVGVAPEGAQLIASGLSTEVVETILQSRAPTTRKL